MLSDLGSRITQFLVRSVYASTRTTLRLGRKLESLRRHINSKSHVNCPLSVEFGLSFIDTQIES